MVQISIPKGIALSVLNFTIQQVVIVFQNKHWREIVTDASDVMKV